MPDLEQLATDMNSAFGTTAGQVGESAEGPACAWDDGRGDDERLADEDGGVDGRSRRHFHRHEHHHRQQRSGNIAGPVHARMTPRPGYCGRE